MRQQKSQTVPQEPNLVPIMNLFLTIIPMLLMMVVISQIALLALNFSQGESGVSYGQGGGGGGAKTEKVEIHILGEQYAQENNTTLGMEIREPGFKPMTISAINGYYDYVTLNKTLQEIRSRKGTLSDITVLVHPDVLYGDLMKTIDICKVNGFTQVHYTATKVEYY
jgi:biopolymer transport protein ExbD